MFSRARILAVVKVVVRRRFKPHSLGGEGHKALLNLKQHALTKPGFLSSEVLNNVSDYHDQLLITQWETIASWEGFRDDPVRIALHAKIMEHLAEPESIKVYTGTSATEGESSLAKKVQELRGGSIGTVYTDRRRDDL
eukprot:RCo038259